MSSAGSDDGRHGVFITFEGGEGAGKSTQVARLKARLERLGHEVVTTREPGGSTRAEAIRELLLGGAAKPFGAFAETLLFAAARADHVERTIRPALARGASVICDRFGDSTRVYQGAVAGLDPRPIAALERIALNGVRPDLTLVLDVPAELGLGRATARRVALGQEADRFEGEAVSFHARVRQAFLEIAAAEPARCAVIDAAEAPDRVEELIWTRVAERLGPAQGRADGEA